MDEIQSYRMEEDAAMGQAIMRLLGEMYGCDPTEAAIKKCVCKYTDCGAWIEFTEKGVKIGSIIEGADLDCGARDIAYTGDDEAFKAEFWARLQDIEDEADELWHEWNDDE